MNFPRQSQPRTGSSGVIQCPQFSTEELPYVENQKKSSPLNQCTSLMIENESNPKNEKNQTVPKSPIRNPFHNSDESVENKNSSIGGFLKGFNMSRISEDFPRRKYSELPQPEIIRSMDFENISFEDKSQDNFLSNNTFFDLCSQGKSKPIQKSNEQIRNELRILISKKNKLSQSYVDPKAAPPAPFNHPMTQSVMLGDTNKDTLMNPFKDLSFTSEKNLDNVERKCLGLFHLNSNSNKNSFGENLSITKSSIQKNCFYESDEESEKEVNTIASKVTFSPSKNSYKFKRNKIFDKLQKIRDSAQKIVPEMNILLNQNESFLTQNKPNWRFQKIPDSPMTSTIPLYRADNHGVMSSNFIRSQSQRSLFSQYQDKSFRPSESFLKKKNLNKYFFESLKRKKSNPKFLMRSSMKNFRYQQTKSANIIEIQNKEKPVKRENRPFSPSLHSGTKSNFWPSHLEDRYLTLESSFTSGLEPFLSCLSPNSKSNKNELSLLKNKILNLNQKISKELLNKKNSFDVEEGKELVSLFFDFVRNSLDDSECFIKRDDLKKIKQI